MFIDGSSQVECKHNTLFPENNKTNVDIKDAKTLHINNFKLKIQTVD